MPELQPRLGAVPAGVVEVPPPREPPRFVEVASVVMQVDVQRQRFDVSAFGDREPRYELGDHRVRIRSTVDLRILDEGFYPRGDVEGRLVIGPVELHLEDFRVHPAQRQHGRFIEIRIETTWMVLGGERLETRQLEELQVALTRHVFTGYVGRAPRADETVRIRSTVDLSEVHRQQFRIRDPLVMGAGARFGISGFTPEAEARAKQLLLEHLTAEQRRQFEGHGHFDVVGGKSRKVFRICNYRSINVHEVNGPRWCYTMPKVPLADQLCAQAMMLQDPASEEAEFMRVAARHPPLADAFSHNMIWGAAEEVIRRATEAVALNTMAEEERLILCGHPGQREPQGILHAPPGARAQIIDDPVRRGFAELRNDMEERVLRAIGGEAQRAIRMVD